MPKQPKTPKLPDNDRTKRPSADDEDEWVPADEPHPLDEEHDWILEDLRSGRIPVLEVDGWTQDPDLTDNELLRWTSPCGDVATIRTAGARSAGGLWFESTLRLGGDPHLPDVALHEDLDKALRVNLYQRRSVAHAHRIDAAALHVMQVALEQLKAPTELEDAERAGYRDHVELLMGLVSCSGTASQAEELVRLVRDGLRERSRLQRHHLSAGASAHLSGRLQAHDDFRALCHLL